MEIAYILVQCKMAHEMEVLKELLAIDLVKEAKGTFGYYDILVKIEEVNKKTKINLVVIRLKDVQKLPADFERKLLELNKKVLFLSNVHLTFNHKFIFFSTIPKYSRIFINF